MSVLASSMPMRAARIHDYGDPDVFEIDEVEPVALGPHDLRVRVEAAAINPIDFKIRKGLQRSVVWLSLPTTLGMDVSGTVVEVGSAVREFAPGDDVYSSPSHKRMGCYAEEVVIRADECAHKPKSISHVEAASLPLVGLTAWDSLVRACNVRPGQRVLIQAGAGGVGTFAIQLAKHLGAEVLTTCSSRNVELVESLGADVVIDYNEQRFEDVAAGCDAILESIGDNVDRSIQTVRRGGRIALIAVDLAGYAKRYGWFLGLLAVGLATAGRVLRARLTRNVRLVPVTRRVSGKNLAKIAKIVDEGGIRPIIDRTYPLEQVAEAHRYLETGRARGKVVLDVAS